MIERDVPDLNKRPDFITKANNVLVEICHCLFWGKHVLELGSLGQIYMMKARLRILFLSRGLVLVTHTLVNTSLY